MKRMLRHRFIDADRSVVGQHIKDQNSEDNKSLIHFVLYFNVNFVAAKKQLYKSKGALSVYLSVIKLKLTALKIRLNPIKII